jgi:phage recombination protein Bet
MSDNGKQLTVVDRALVKPFAQLDYSDRDLLEVIRAGNAKGTTDAEFAYFVNYCKTTGLNPLKHEVWCIIIPEDRAKNRQRQVQIMTGLWGFWMIANSHQMFDGADPVEYEYKDNRLFAASCRAYRKDRSRPAVGRVFWDEYALPYGNWKSKPHVMLGKCAEAAALKRLFPNELGDVYAEEEMPKDFSSKVQGPEPGKKNRVQGGTWSYCIMNAPEDKLPGILDYIEKNQDAIIESIPECDIYVFRKNMSRLANYRVTSDVVEEAKSMRDAVPVDDEPSESLDGTDQQVE